MTVDELLKGYYIIKKDCTYHGFQISNEQLHYILEILDEEIFRDKWNSDIFEELQLGVSGLNINKKLNAAQQQQIIELYGKGNISMNKLGKQFDVSGATISNVINKKGAYADKE